MASSVWAVMGDLDCFTVPDEASNSSVNGPRFPVSVGYNNVAEVVDVGHGVEDLDRGRRVFVLGRHAECFDVRAWEVTPIPEKICDEEAAPAYLATLGLHALRRANWQPGEPVLVIGLGLVGLSTALVADACGAELVCVEIDSVRRDLASAAMSAARVIDPKSRDGNLTVGLSRADLPVAIEAAGGEPALRQAMSLVAPKGRIAVLALHPEPMGPILGEAYYDNEVSLVATTNDPYLPDPPGSNVPFTLLSNIGFVLGLVARGRLSLKPLCSHVFAADDIAEAYAALASGEDRGLVGALLDWR